MSSLSQPRLNIFTVGSKGVMICLGQGGLRSLSASSFLLKWLTVDKHFTNVYLSLFIWSDTYFYCSGVIQLWIFSHVFNLVLSLLQFDYYFIFSPPLQASHPLMTFNYIFWLILPDSLDSLSFNFKIAPCCLKFVPPVINIIIQVFYFSCMVFCLILDIFRASLILSARMLFSSTACGVYHFYFVEMDVVTVVGEEI